MLNTDKSLSSSSSDELEEFTLIEVDDERNGEYTFRDEEVKLFENIDTDTITNDNMTVTNNTNTLQKINSQKQIINKQPRCNLSNNENIEHNENISPNLWQDTKNAFENTGVFNLIKLCCDF